MKESEKQVSASRVPLECWVRRLTGEEEDMSKSKTRFNKPRMWSPHAPRVMAEDVAGGWVRLHDYNELLAAYKGALVQLDRAGKRIAGMTPNA